MDQHAAQCAVDDTEFEYLVNCLDNCEQQLLTSMSSYPLSLSLLRILLCCRVLVVKWAPHSECFAEDIAGILSNKVDAGIMSHLS